MLIAITFFIFALLLGVAVIGRVPATLHTPLMSGANSIHGVVLVGVIIVAAHSNSVFGNILIFFAALLGTLNVVGGYVVTDRMLEMFKTKPNEAQKQDSESIEGLKLSVTEVIQNDFAVPDEVAAVVNNLKEDPILARSVVVESNLNADVPNVTNSSTKEEVK